LYTRRCENCGPTTNTAKVIDETTKDPIGGAVVEVATPLTLGQVIKGVGSAVGVNSTETTTENVTMEVQIDDEIDEDDGERYSSYSMSSVEDEPVDGSDGSHQTTVTKVTCDEDDIYNDLETQTKDHSCSSAVIDSTTSPPPDVIMHHNNDVIKRKSSRRSRRKRRSNTTATVVSDLDVHMTPAVGMVGEEEPLVPSSSLPTEIATIITVETTTTIMPTNTNNTNNEQDDDITAQIVDSNAVDNGTTVVDIAFDKDNSDYQLMAKNSLQTQQVGY